MQAIVLHGKQDLRFDPNYPTPKPAPGEVLLKLTYSSICQTDIEMWQPSFPERSHRSRGIWCRVA